MATYSVWMLEASRITVSGGQTLSGITQGDGSHLRGETIRFADNGWLETSLVDDDLVFADNDGSQRLDGAQVIDGVTFADGSVVEAEYRLKLTDPDTGETWEVLGYNVNNSSPAYATVEGLAFVGPVGGFPPVGRDLLVTGAFEGPAIPAGDLASPPCFVAGTRILTPGGLRAVEDLAPGDMVVTRDAGAQPLRWTGRVEIDAARLAAEPEFRPVRITAGAFGPQRPARDLLVSRQHRVLVTGPALALLFGHDEMLCAAAHLIDGRAVRVEPGAGAVVYHHLLFDRHQIVFAEGLEAESFLPGEVGLEGAGSAAQAELLALFPELGQGAAEGALPALALASRPVMRRHEAAVFARLPVWRTGRLPA